MKKQVFVLIFLFTVCFSSPAQTNKRSFVGDSLDNYINIALKQQNIPGIAIAIVKDGKVVLAKGYGVRNIESKAEVNENTIFMIGSNTKAFTGTLVSWLVNDQKCTLNDKVVKWLPGFKMKDQWVTSNLNLTDILSHRMGMETFQGDFMYWTSDLTNEEVLQKFGQLTPNYDFRTKWGYTNAGFLIAGECIRKISGESWESNLKKRILEPLQMTRTIPLSADLSKQENSATAYTLVFDTLITLPFPLIDNLAPAAFMSSSVSDMSKWLTCQLDSGRYNNKSIIPFPVIKTTRVPRSIIGNARPSFNNGHYRLYGLGWDLEDYEGMEIVSHNGGVNGFVSSVTLIPEEKLGIVVLTNTDQNYFYEALKMEILDAYLGLSYRNYSELYNGYFKRKANSELLEYISQKDSASKAKTELKNFTGHYVHPVYGYLNITQNNKQLLVSFEHHSKLKATLEYIGSNRFLCTYSDPTYGIKVWDFTIENKKVKSLTLRVADFLEYTTYEFVKQ